MCRMAASITGIVEREKGYVWIVKVIISRGDSLLAVERAYYEAPPAEGTAMFSSAFNLQLRCRCRG